MTALGDVEKDVQAVGDVKALDSCHSMDEVSTMWKK